MGARPGRAGDDRRQGRRVEVGGEDEDADSRGRSGRRARGRRRRPTIRQGAGSSARPPRVAIAVLAGELVREERLSERRPVRARRSPAAGGRGGGRPARLAEHRDVADAGCREREQDRVARGVLADPADDLDGGTGRGGGDRDGRAQPACGDPVRDGRAIGLPTMTIME